MSINFLIEKEISEILENKEDSFSNYSTSIKIKFGEDQWLTPTRIEHMLLIRGYGSGEIGDFRTIDFLIGYGDLVFDLLANKDDLMVEVVNTPRAMVGGDLNPNRKITVKRYRGIINEKAIENPAVTNKMPVEPNRANLNHLGLIHVQLQLIDEIVYKLLTMSCGMTYRQVTTMNALLSIYSKYLKLLGNKENERVDNFNIRKGYNPNVRHQINIPDGTMVKDVHRHLQDKEGGIYPTGIGRYIQNGTLYVYPLYDTEGYKKNTKVLNVINIPSSRFEGAECTFKDEALKLTIIAAGESKVEDKGLINQLMEGNAVRFGNASNLLRTTIEKGNKMLMDKSSNMFEVAISKLKTGANNVRMAANVMTSNPFKQYSDMARKQGMQIDVDWTKGDSELLTPGMPVKYITLDGPKVKIYYGVLFGVSENRIPTTPGVVTNSFSGVVKLTLFVSRVEHEE